jgi:hypothetical protein
MQSTISRRRRPGAGLAVGFGGTSEATGLLSGAGFDSSLGIAAILLLGRVCLFGQVRVDVRGATLFHNAMMCYSLFFSSSLFSKQQTMARCNRTGSLEEPRFTHLPLLNRTSISGANRALVALKVDLVPDQQNKTLTVRLHPLTAEVHDQVVRYLCEELTSTEIVFPTTDLRLVYEIAGSC